MWKVYAGNLDSHVRERGMAEKLRAYGVVRSVWIARHPPGYAFLELDTCQEADDAISALDGGMQSPPLALLSFSSFFQFILLCRESSESGRHAQLRGRAAAEVGLL